jgi:HEAT repeat protein
VGPGAGQPAARPSARSEVMAAEETLDLKRLVTSVGSANEPEKQAEILNHALSRLSLRQAADAWAEIAARSLDDLMYAKAFLAMLDVPVLNAVAGKKTVGQWHFTFKGTDKFKDLFEVFDAMHTIDPKLVKLVKAKAAMLFQLMYLVKDRIVEDGLPMMRVNATEMVKRVLSDPEVGIKKIKIDLNNYGRAYWNTIVEQLKEADFQSKDNVIYEMLLNDSLVEQYQTGSILTASGAGGAGEARLSDAVLARLGTNIIKRLNLLLRTTQMYQSVDHPSVSAALEALLATIENAMQGREGLTISRLGGDLLIEDIKIKKKEKFVDDFVVALEQRNVNSMSLKRGISLEEVRAFLMIFALTEAQVKKQGGVKKILETKGVSHVQVDQFRYGIISGEVEEETETMAADEKMISSVVFSEVLTKIQKGDVDKLSPAELGSMIKEMLTGQLSRDKNARRSLAQMILALDPDLAEQAVFAKEGLRDEMSWSSARKMIDQLLGELGRGNPDDRIHTVENLERMAEVAITRNKETSLTQIIERLNERLRSKERDPEVLARLFDAMANICRFLILNVKYTLALKIVRSVHNLVNYCENLPVEKKDDYTRALCELGAMMMISISKGEVIQALIRELESETMATVDTGMKLLEFLGTEQVISELLESFKSPSRTLRNRAFQVLTAMGEKSLVVCQWKLRHLSDPTQFSRRTEAGEMTEESYYVARNCIDLIERLGSKREVELVRQISDDPDPRIRAATISALAKLDANEGVLLAKLRLSDGEPLVAEAAINVLGQSGNGEVVPSLIDLFYAEPRLRTPVLHALGRIGSEECEKVLIEATRYKRGGALGKVFWDDETLRMTALKALGIAGRNQALAALRNFIRVSDNVMLRLLLVPWRFHKQRKDLMRVASDSLSRVEYRVKTPAA